MNIQREVEGFRHAFGDVWRTPHPRDTYLFVLTEVAEIGDWILRNMPLEEGYLRMHERNDDITEEIGDALVMLCTLATQLDVDIERAVKKSLAKVEGKVIAEKVIRCARNIAREQEGR